MLFRSVSQSRYINETNYKYEIAGPEDHNNNNITGISRYVSNTTHTSVDMYIGHAGTTGNNLIMWSKTQEGVLRILNDNQGANSLLVGLADPDSATGSYQFSRDIHADYTAGPVFYANQDNAADDQPVIAINNGNKTNTIHKRNKLQIRNSRTRRPQQQ